MSAEDVDQIISESDNPDSLGWESVKSALGGTDKVQKTGAALGSYWAGIKTGIAPTGEDIVKSAPENLSVGGKEVNLKSMAEEGHQLFNEKVWARERNAETLLEEATMRADKLGHYSVGYLTAAGTQRAVDRMTGEYDPKKVALGGMMAVPIYAVAKEGWYEGGSGIQFNLESMDVWGDWMADTAGALHSVHNYHKKKTAAEGEEPQGLLRSTANLMGRGYGRLENGAADLAGSVSEKKNGYSLEMPDIGLPDLDYGTEGEESEFTDSSAGLSDLTGPSDTEEGSLDSVYSSDPLIETPDYSIRDELEEVSEYSGRKIEAGVQKASAIGESITSGLSSLASGFRSSSSESSGSEGSRAMDEVYS